MMFNFDPAIPREFYDPGGTYKRSHEGQDHARTGRFWRPPGNDRASMITMIASMYPVARKLARNFSTGVPYSRPLADRPTQTGETFNRKMTRASGGALIIAVTLSLVMLFVEERSRMRSPGHQAQTGVSGGPLKRILISDCCYLNAQ